MFKNPFSFSGRIRRTEFGISLIIYTVISFAVNAGMMINETTLALGVLYIPMLWFLWAQGAKRCHDRDNSGFYQLIPFYGLWMLFAAGDEGSNRFGPDPKCSQDFELEAEAF
ncbi:uncharacterized membrane protein YhaH (DUF805 family) [Pontibacter aydingkolensis]|uniref:DUF805 domain-containing protein n=1 Tax=Pontibacter aydingkolensis TaxID=1911536 RepID=A0ABS7CQ09_9BACT|nr:DUF805 domain-containing protein [Pontibacter aydingkolensis]MBW7465932.1 DUF805 domain-containing protein [Pontibacter aydingkolensis]